jgi:hypothetical protein
VRGHRVCLPICLCPHNIFFTKWQEREADIYFHLVARLRIREATGLPPLPHTSPWCGALDTETTLPLPIFQVSRYGGLATGRYAVITAEAMREF